jgi:subtilisin family serine protease
MLSLLSLFSFGLTSVLASSVILTPKEHQLHTFDFNSFNVEHNIGDLASVGDLTLYKTTSDNYLKYKNTFDHLFDVEEEQVYTVNPVDVSSDNDNENEHVLFVQEPGNSEFKITESVPWHLDRLSKRHLPLDGSYAYNTPGSCHRNSDVEIETVVVDTGSVNHVNFGDNQPTFLENFSGDNIDKDCNSHSTHCLGLVGSRSYGVCKDAKLFAVKVLTCEGSGSTAGVIQGMNYAFNRHLEREKQNPKLRTIMSMSLGGGKSLAMNRVVERMVKMSDTFYIAVAAGNENSNACNTSPASARGIFTVNAMGKDDQRAYFSNFGKCTDIYTPGVEILSTVLDNKTAVYSGTSMSTPILVGVMNHYLDMYPNLNMKQLKEKILSDATKDTIEGNPKQTSNLMVYLNRND